MDRQAFRDELHSALRGILLDRLHEYVETQFEAYQQMVRYFSALDHKYDDPAAAIREGLPSIFSRINQELNQQRERKFSVFYESVVDQVVEQFPALEIWQQTEDRFATVDEDSLFVTIGKGSKSLARSTARGWHTGKKRMGELFGQTMDGWEPWKQEIPLRRVIKYHLLSKKVTEDWLHSLMRFQLKYISDIENVLVNEIRNGETGSFEELADSLQEKLKTQKNDLIRKIDESVNEPESEILWISPKVGTIERRATFYSETRLNAHAKDFEKSLSKIEAQWLDVLDLLLDRNKNIAHFHSLQTDVQQQCDEFLEDFHLQLEECIEYPLQQLFKKLEDAGQSIKNHDDPRAIQSVKNDLESYVVEQLTPPIEKLLHNEILSKKTEHFFENILMQANQVPQQLSFVYDLRFEKDPPSADQKQMEWRLLVVRTIREQIMSDLQPEKQDYEAFLSLLLTELEEIKDIIEVNLESAISVENVDQDDSASEISWEALQRLQSKVEELQAKYHEKWDTIRAAIQEGRQNFSQSLLSLLHDGDTQALQLINAKYSVKETTKGWQDKLDSRWVRIQDRVILWGRFSWQKSKKYVKEIRKFAGFQEEQIQESQRADIATYLSETDQKLKGLPYIYRRLFNFDAQADQRFYVSLAETKTVLEKAFEQWHKAYPATVAVVGEKGSGKSTFLNLAAETQLPETKVTQIVMNETLWTEEALAVSLSKELTIADTKSIDDIITALQDKGERQVIILEGIQNCFIRNVNGYDAIEKLSYLISETKEQVFWVISCSRYAWRFLDKIENVSEYFSHILRTDTLDTPQIEKVIMNRHRASGYSLQFEADDSMLRSRAYRKLDREEEAQEYLRRNYFAKLAELSEGNASIAMIFWIRSIREFDETCFYIKPLEVTSIEMIEELSPPVLFTLATFVMHDTISDMDLSMILNLSKEESRLMLSRLHARGLLLKVNQYYSLNHLIYRQIIRVLKERNIIHLV